MLQRYIEYLSARIKGRGGDPDAIPPPPDGAPKDVGMMDLVEYTGKVVKVFYDCFGDLEGFVLGDCCMPKVFKTKEKAIGEIALRACKDRLLLTVFVKRGHDYCIVKIVVKC